MVCPLLRHVKAVLSPLFGSWGVALRECQVLHTLPGVGGTRSEGPVISGCEVSSLTGALRPSKANGGPGTGPSLEPSPQRVVFSETKESALIAIPSGLVQSRLRAVNIYLHIL